MGVILETKSIFNLWQFHDTQSREEVKLFLNPLSILSPVSKKILPLPCPLNDFFFDEPPGASDPMDRNPVLFLQKAIHCRLTESEDPRHLLDRYELLHLHPSSFPYT